MFNAESSITKAVKSCIARTGSIRSHTDILEALKRGNPFAHSRLRYSIASDIAGYIKRKYKGDILGTKLYGSTMYYRAGIYSDIDILVHALRRGSTVKLDIKEVDNRLVAGYCSLMDKSQEGLSYLIDLQVIDESLKNTENCPPPYLRYILSCDSTAIV